MSSKASHTVVVTETTPSGTASLGLNIRVLKTPSALLKLFETIVGTICFSVLTHGILKAVAAGMEDDDDDSDDEELTSGEIKAAIAVIMFYMITLAFLITTFLLLVSFLISNVSAMMIQKTIFELMYHALAFLFYLVTSFILLVGVSQEPSNSEEFPVSITITVFGLTNAVLYGMSTYFSYKSFKS